MVNVRSSLIFWRPKVSLILKLNVSFLCSCQWVFYLMLSRAFKLTPEYYVLFFERITLQNRTIFFSFKLCWFFWFWVSFIIILVIFLLQIGPRIRIILTLIIFNIWNSKRIANKDPTDRILIVFRTVLRIEIWIELSIYILMYYWFVFRTFSRLIIGFMQLNSRLNLLFIGCRKIIILQDRLIWVMFIFAFTDFLLFHSKILTLNPRFLHFTFFSWIMLITNVLIDLILSLFLLPFY